VLVLPHVARPLLYPDKKFKDLKFPKEALVLCLGRGDEVIIPDGSTRIHPEDRVVILATRKNIEIVSSVAEPLRRFREMR
jgi:Trk K+ transport system NAD-binding subunit